MGQPGYLHTLLNTYQPLHSLCSQDNHLLAKPLVYTSTGRRTRCAFSYADPQIWNAIPLNIRNSQSVGSFKCKNILFCCSLLISYPLISHVLPATARASNSAKLTNIVLFKNYLYSIV